MPGCGVSLENSTNTTDLPAAVQCPVGFYGPGDAADANTTANPGCIACPLGQSTSTSGSAVCDGKNVLKFSVVTANPA